MTVGWHFKFGWNLGRWIKEDSNLVVRSVKLDVENHMKSRPLDLLQDESQLHTQPTDISAINRR